MKKLKYFCRTTYSIACNSGNNIYSESCLLFLQNGEFFRVFSCGSHVTEK